MLLVEHRRFELLTPTLPVLCATNCANAPRFSEMNHTTFKGLCKAFFSKKFDFFVEGVANLCGKRISKTKKTHFLFPEKGRKTLKGELF